VRGRLHEAAGLLRQLGLARLAQRRAVRLERVEALSAGTMRVSAATSGVQVLSGSRTFSSAGRAALRLHLTAAGRRLARHRPRLALRLTGSFTGRGGLVTHTQSVRVVIGR
jgi:hypothetical protein